MFDFNHVILVVKLYIRRTRLTDAEYMVDAGNEAWLLIHSYNTLVVNQGLQFHDGRGTNFKIYLYFYLARYRSQAYS